MNMHREGCTIKQKLGECGRLCMGQNAEETTLLPVMVAPQSGLKTMPSYRLMSIHIAKISEQRQDTYRNKSAQHALF